MSKPSPRIDSKPSIARSGTHSAFLLTLLSVLASLSGCGIRMPERSQLDVEQANVIVKAIHVDHRLWMITAGGVLSSVVDKSDLQQIAKLPGPALGLWTDGVAPVVVTVDRADSTWTVLRQNHGAWIRLATLSKGEDNFIGGSAGQGANTILTFHRIIEISETGQAEESVTWPKLRMRGRVASFLLAVDAAYVGFDSGEWGGGLAKVDRRTREASLIENAGDKSPCAGPLNTKCDPVHGIVALPWKPGCLAISVGLQHMLSLGRVVEVCGTDVRGIYLDPDPEYQEAGDPSPSVDENVPSTAFYGIAVIRDQIWVVGTNGIHQISRNGSATIVPFPAFHRAGDIEYSDSIPEILLVRPRQGPDSILSTRTPLIIPR